MRYHLSTKPLLAAIVGIGTLATPVATQFSYTYNNDWHAAHPSATRQAFKREFGVTLQGWEADIEDNADHVRDLARVLATERAEHPTAFTLNITSENFFKKSWQEMQIAIQTWQVGEANFETNTVAVDAKESPRALIHEIKHLKTYAALQAHPEFFERWEAVVKSNGHTYRTQEKRAQQMSKFSNPPRDDVACWQQGFISCYAKQDPWEDIAELATHVELESRDAVNPEEQTLLSALQNNMQEYQQKVTLLQEYGIIPKEFSERAQLLIQRDTLQPQDKQGQQAFLAKSSEFRNKYPQSTYAGQVHADRAESYGDLARFSPNSKEKRKLLEQTISEWTRALEAAHADPRVQRMALYRLHSTYEELGMPEQAAKTDKLFERSVTQELKRIGISNTTSAK